MLENWFDVRGWAPFEYQRQAWRAFLDGRSGLIHAPTGVGKSLAAWLGPVIERLREGEPVRPARSSRGRPLAEPIRVLWITPMRALASDTVLALEEPVHAAGLPWSIEKRTGDTAASVKRRQRDRLPTALVTTPESLSLILSYPESRAALATLRCVVVDEWHELLSTKRGTQTELALARLRAWARADGRALGTWGLSATLGNLEQAARALVGVGPHAPAPALVRGIVPKAVQVDTVRPRDVERFPQAGHMGLASLGAVADAIDASPGTTLLFTNTRAQAEIWYKRLLDARPDWLTSGGAAIAIHHGSLEREIRSRVEEFLKAGRLRCVVCTSSLDLGVDFSPVDQVIQVGSPRGVARLIQRAGRSGHRPGVASRILGVPTHAMELVEFAAVRDAIAGNQVESRAPLNRPLDVLVQHLVTIAAGGGFVESELLDEVRSSAAFADLSDAEWTWAMDFVRGGGRALHAYPQYARIRPDETSRFGVASPQIARLHRLGIGTISSDSGLKVAYLSGRSLGTIEESFIARLRPGSRFAFAGRILELIDVHEMTAIVRRSTRKSGLVPRWNGGRFPLSTQLAAGVRAKLEAARRGEFSGPDMQAVRPLLDLQARWSVIPGPGQLLVEQVRTDDGHHVFLFPFEGRLAHEGLGALLAYRLSLQTPRSITATATDYGLELFSDAALEIDEPLWRLLLRADNLVEDLLNCLNSTQLARRQFRDIARVAGLIIPGFPGGRSSRGGGPGGGKSMRQIQASSDMFFDVLSEFDPGNLLLDQARREVLENQLEFLRLREALVRAGEAELVMQKPGRLTPFAFPVWAERLRSTHVSSESWSTLVAKMALRLEQEADPARADPAPPPAPALAGEPVVKVSKRFSGRGRMRRANPVAKR